MANSTSIIPQPSQGQYQDEPEQSMNITAFKGINQSVDEEIMDPAETPDAMNVVSENGGIVTAPGTVQYDSDSEDFDQNILDIFPFYGGSEATSFLMSRQLYEEGVRDRTKAGTIFYVEGRNAQYPLWFVNYQIGETKYLIFGNGVDAPYKYDGSGGSATLLSDGIETARQAPAGFQPMAVFNERLFGVVKGDVDRVYFSDALDPTNWLGTTSEGGFKTVMTWDGGVCVNVVPFSDQLLVFKTTSIFRISGTDPTNFISVRTLASGGTKAPKSVAVTDNKCYYLGDDGIYIFDGMQATRISSRIQNIIDSISPDYIDWARGVFYNGQYILAVTLRQDINGVKWSDFASFGSQWETHSITPHQAGPGWAGITTTPWDQMELDVAAADASDIPYLNLNLSTYFPVTSAMWETVKTRYYIVYARIGALSEADRDLANLYYRIDLASTKKKRVDASTAFISEGPVLQSEAEGTTYRYEKCQMLRFTGEELLNNGNTFKLGVVFTAGTDAFFSVGEMSIREVSKWDYENLSDIEMYYKYAFIYNAMNRLTSLIIYDERQDAFFLQSGLLVTSWLNFFGKLLYTDYTGVINQYGHGRLINTLSRKGQSLHYPTNQYAYWRTPDSSMGLPNGKKKMNTLYCVAQSDLSLRMQVYSESPMKETSYTLSKARLVRKLKMRSKGRKLSFRLILSGYGQNVPEAQRMATETSPQPAITSYTRIINPVLQYDVDMD